MRYEEIKPRVELSSFIKCYWVLEDDTPVELAQRIVPDGCPELIINLGRPFQHEENGLWHSQPEVFVVGQLTAPFVVRPHGFARTIGVRFRPAGASRLWQMPIFELTDVALSLAEISPKLHRMVSRLREMDTPADQLTALERVLLGAAQQVEEDFLISFAVRECERSKGEISIPELSEQTGLSTRQFQRRFRAKVGVAPKFFCRLQRFQHVFRAIEEPNATWVDAAVSCGYFDQAHLIRDFREFSGTTPTALIAEEYDLSREFVRNRSLSHFSKTAPKTLR